MNEYPNVLKEKLTSLIKGLAASPAAFLKNPGTDFIRNRKLPFETMMQLIISMGGNSVYKELLESSGYKLNTATTSAFVQQRDKILPYAFEYLFREFTGAQTTAKTYRGCRLRTVHACRLRQPLMMMAHISRINGELPDITRSI
jgi:hypothetical protein